MKLVFKKNEQNEISVVRRIGDKEQDFSYVDMIKALIETKSLEPPDVLGGFSEAEKSSIKSMTSFINKSLSVSDLPEDPNPKDK